MGIEGDEDDEVFEGTVCDIEERDCRSNECSKGDHY